MLAHISEVGQRRLLEDTECMDDMVPRRDT